MLTFRARIARKQPDLPRFVVVPAELVAGRTGAFAATVTLNGGPAFQRNVRPWGKGQDVYFFNLTEPQCTRSGVDTGDICDIVLTPLDA